MNILLLLVSVLVAFLLSIVGVPEFLLLWRPEWAALVVFYWVLEAPGRIGLVFAWSVGFLLDILEGTLMGMNALALALVAYLILSMHQRIKMFPILQQSFIVFLIVGISLMLCHWIKSVTGVRPGDMSFLLPAVSSALIWPLFYVVMRRLDRY